jgi:hypothetical protein
LAGHCRRDAAARTVPVVARVTRRSLRGALGRLRLAAGGADEALRWGEWLQRHGRHQRRAGGVAGAGAHRWWQGSAERGARRHASRCELTSSRRRRRPPCSAARRRREGAARGAGPLCDPLGGRKSHSKPKDSDWNCVQVTSGAARGQSWPRAWYRWPRRGKRSSWRRVRGPRTLPRTPVPPSGGPLSRGGRVVHLGVDPPQTAASRPHTAAGHGGRPRCGGSDSCLILAHHVKDDSCLTCILAHHVKDDSCLTCILAHHGKDNSCLTCILASCQG